MLLCKSCCQFLHYLGILVTSRLNDTHEELGWNAESEHAINISSHDFEMHQCLEELRKVEEANIHDLDVQVPQINLELRVQLLILCVLVGVVFKLLANKAAFLEHFHVIDDLLLHASHSPELVTIWVLCVQVLFTVGHNAWLHHHLLMSSFPCCEFLVDNLVHLLLAHSLLLC